MIHIRKNDSCGIQRICWRNIDPGFKGVSACARTYSREKANSNHGHDDQLQACGAASCTTKVDIHGCILTLLDLPISKRIEICRNV